jgi:hypothetical protein
VKEDKIKVEQAKKEVMSAIQDTFRIFSNREFSTFEIKSYSSPVGMIRLLRQKAIDKKDVSENSKLGPNEIVYSTD